MSINKSLTKEVESGKVVQTLLLIEFEGRMYLLFTPRSPIHCLSGNNNNTIINDLVYLCFFKLLSNLLILSTGAGVCAVKYKTGKIPQKSIVGVAD